jgi:hypothetical protein
VQVQNNANGTFGSTDVVYRLQIIAAIERDAGEFWLCAPFDGRRLQVREPL